MGLFTTLQALLNVPSEDIVDYAPPASSEDIILEGDYVEDIYGGVGKVDIISLSPFGGQDLYAYVTGNGWADWIALVKVA